MAIISRINLIKRIMIGEALINPEVYELIKKCLQTIEKGDVHSIKFEVGKYFKELDSSPKSSRRRRKKIREYIEEKFKDKNADEIREMLENEENLVVLKKIDFPIFIDDIDYENCLREANYDLRLGEDIYVTTEKVPRKLTTMSADSSIAIEPGEFGVLMTHEYIYVPQDLMGLISIRLTYKQKGLVNISGFHVDPGFYGRLMFTVFNAGPNDVILRFKERVFMIMFSELDTPVPEVIKSIWYGLRNIPIETIQGLRGTSVSVRNIHERVNRLEMIFPILVTGIVGLAFTLLAWVLTHW